MTALFESVGKHTAHHCPTGPFICMSEMENEVRAHPDVANVAASEDEIKLVVMLKQGAQLTERALLDFLTPACRAS